MTTEHEMIIETEMIITVAEIITLTLIMVHIPILLETLYDDEIDTLIIFLYHKQL